LTTVTLETEIEITGTYYPGEPESQHNPGVEGHWEDVEIVICGESFLPTGACLRWCEKQLKEETK
jgi:hypothetical protein